MSKNLGVSITWLGHATVLYTASNGKRVLVDPWLESNPACPDAFKKKLDPIDLLLVTHGHSDHFGDVRTIVKHHQPDVVAMHEIAQYLSTKKVENVRGMNKGGSMSLQSVTVTMVNAVHSSAIREGDTLIPAGDPCGFVIEFPGGTRVYHAGDTAVHSDMNLIGQIYKPAISVLPIGDLYTMSPLEASFAARMLGSRYIVPIHHSTFPALTGTPAALRERLRDRSDIEVLELKPGETAS